jgi:hypothetical protein
MDVKRIHDALHGNDWITDQGELLEFATALWEAGYFDTSIDGGRAAAAHVLEVFAKPWHHSIDHTAWVEAGRPMDDTCDGWITFVESL